MVSKRIKNPTNKQVIDYLLKRKFVHIEEKKLHRIRFLYSCGVGFSVNECIMDREVLRLNNLVEKEIKEAANECKTKVFEFEKITVWNPSQMTVHLNVKDIVSVPMIELIYLGKIGNETNHSMNNVRSSFGDYCQRHNTQSVSDYKRMRD